MIKTTYIGLGSNLGNKKHYLDTAIKLLGNHGTVSAISNYYTTKPWGYLDQDNFLNAAIEYKTNLSPQKLLETCQQIETQLGRIRTIKNGPRTIDLDILLYENKIINTPDLTIPHPGMHERTSVLKPMCDIAPNTMHPVLKKTIQELLIAIPRE